MRSKTWLAAVGLLALFTVAGCSERTEEAAETATQSAAQDTQENVAQAGQAVENAGEKVAEETAEAGQAVAQGAENVGEYAGQAVGGAAETVQDAGAVATLTPKVKNALIVDKQVNATNVNVETLADQKTVIIKGAVATAAAKNRATQVAQKVLTDSQSDFKVRNELSVGGAATTP